MGKYIRDFWKRHVNEMVLALIFAYLGLYVLYFAYIKDTYISPDSVDYLKEADAILNGFGFNETALSGYDTWFAKWPIGYPLMIAAVSLLTGRNAYLSSKILSIVCVGFILLLLYAKFKKDAWIFALCLLNTGFLDVYVYTWSEIPFCLFLLLFCLIFTYIVERAEVKFKWFVLLGISGVLMFMCRYIGAFSAFVIGAALFLNMTKYIFRLNAGLKDDSAKKKMLGYFVADTILVSTILSYFFLNYIKVGTISGKVRLEMTDSYADLTIKLFDVLLAEIYSIAHVTMSKTFSLLSWHYKAMLVLLFILFVFSLMNQNKEIDFKTVFISVAFIYNVVFIVIRYLSTMDNFNYRFFVPSSVLLTIGLLGFMYKKVGSYRDKIAVVIICILLVPSIWLFNQVKDLDRENTAYRKLRETCLNVTESIPKRSTIFESDFEDYRKVSLFRPDINFVSEIMMPEDTPESLLGRYAKSNYICIKAELIKELISNPNCSYNESLIRFLASYLEDNPDGDYIIIPCMMGNIK